MRFKQVKLGSSVEITLERDGYKLRLISKVEDAKEDHIAVTLIVGNGKKFVFKDTDEIELIYKEKERLWRWTGVKGKTQVLDGVQVHAFYADTEGESYNRRNAFRIYVGEEVAFRYVRNVEEDGSEQGEAAETRQVREGSCIIKDLSEGGAGILTKDALQKSDAVSFALETEYGVIGCIGMVVREAKEQESPYRNFYGIQFTKVSSAITKYIYAQQRIQLKKTRG